MSVSPQAAPQVMLSINTAWNIYNFRRALLTGLRDAGYRVITAAPEDAYASRLTLLVDKHCSIPMQNDGTSPWQDALLCWRYFWLMRRERPAVYLGYTIKPNVYGTLAAAMLGIPVINNVSGLGTAFIRRGWLTRVACALYRVAFRYSACVFFQNSEDRDLFVSLRILPENRTAVLPGSGINLEHFAPPAEQDEAARPKDKVVFLLIARMLWDKGIGEYVEAARRIQQQYPQAVFQLLGPVGVANQTAIPAATLATWQAEGVITYLGESDDVRSALHAADCVVLPSYREGLSRVLLEAAACGKPLIATDVAGCRQVVEESRNGFLCRPQDAADLAEQCLKFIALDKSARAQMGAASRAKAEREFDERRVVEAYLEQIAALLVRSDMRTAARDGIAAPRTLAAADKDNA